MHDTIKKIIKTSKSPTARRMGVIEKLHRKNKKLNIELIATKAEYEQKLTDVFDEHAELNKIHRGLQEKYTETKRLQLAAQSELKRINPVHPFLDAEVQISPMYHSVEDPLRYRLTAPKMDWDDKTDTGMVRLVCKRDGDIPETLGYAFSEKALYLHQSYILDKMVADFSRIISEQLVDCVRKQTVKKY